MKLLLTIVLLFSLIQCNESYINAPTQGKYSNIDQIILKFVNQYQITGLSVSIVKNNKLHWANSYGWSNMGQQVPLSNRTMIRVASVSKIISITAVLKLYESGHINLDEDISKYLGYVVRNPHYPEKAITVRHLINHRSGIIEYNGLYTEFTKNTYQNIEETSLQDVLAPGGKYYSDSFWTRYKPGTRYIYSNIGYGIIATIVENITNTDFDTYCHNIIFNKLRMNASFNLSKIDQSHKKANLYRYLKKEDAYELSLNDFDSHLYPSYYSRYKIGTNAFFFSPHGGLRSNAIDLSSLMIEFLKNGDKILKTKTVKLFFKQKRFGIYKTTNLINNQELYGHSGSAYGLISHFYFNPIKKYGIIFIITGANDLNKNSSGYFKIEKELTNILFNHFIQN